MNEHHIDTLKSYKLSVTPIRLAVLSALEDYPHAEADAIYNIVKEKISATSKQAIYNNLHTLLEHGLIREIRPKGRPSLYEARVGDNHHHLVCTQCNAVKDTECLDVAPCLRPATNHGFQVQEAEIVFWGLCPDCQTKPNQKGEKK